MIIFYHSLKIYNSYYRKLSYRDKIWDFCHNFLFLFQSLYLYYFISSYTLLYIFIYFNFV